MHSTLIAIVRNSALTSLVCLCASSVDTAGAFGPSAGAARSVHYLRFQTGTARGQKFPAAYCRIATLGEQQLECWTPNDGYTIRLDGLPLGGRRDARPFHASGDSRSHYRLTLRGSRYLPRGVVERYGSFTCVSRASDLTCRNEGGHGYTLPRYVGVPRTF